MSIEDIPASFRWRIYLSISEMIVDNPAKDSQVFLSLSNYLIRQTHPPHPHPNSKDIAVFEGNFLYFARQFATRDSQSRQNDQEIQQNMVRI